MSTAKFKLSLRDKIGQMLIMGFEGKQVDKNSRLSKQLMKTILVVLFYLIITIAQKPLIKILKVPPR